MPSWSIHLSIAKEVNKVFNLDKDLFYYGNTLPDVDRKFGFDRDKTHYYGIPYDFCPKEDKIDINKFLEDYKDSLDNPLILGYYSHLLTDNYYNEIVYKNCWVYDKNFNIIGIKLKNGKIHYIDIDDKKREKRSYKHHDFELYGKYLFKSIDIPKNREKIYGNIKAVKYNLLSKEIIDYRINYFNDKFKRDNKLTLYENIFKHQYKLFTKKELDIIYNDCIKHVIYEIKKVKGML